ncbi:uncharacterized protein LOC134277658 isoform X1 [Saccostrea cucullata]|uniref:uncharacterized protein LOC134277658 isoform X1 n=1 Tax=Saccostrea cuccullata TaxID=36930 RepID=UPI002ED49566
MCSSLHSVHAQAETTSNSSVTGLIFAIGRLGANYSRRCVHYLVEAYKSPFGQTSSISLTGKEVKLTTVLWISGGVFMALILGLAICCTRGKCQKNTQERSPLSIPHSYPAFPVAETPPRPEARVRPFNNQGSVSSREESRPLLSPNNSPTSYSAVENPSGRSDHFVERLAGQNHSHPINVQGYNEYLRTAPTLDPNSITEDRSQWEDLEEIGDLNIPVDDQFQTGYSSLSNEQIDYATST